MGNQVHDFSVFRKGTGMNCRKGLFAVLGVLGLTLLAVPLLLAGDQPVSWSPGETAEQRDTRMAWWREAKFGMLIHWGVYSITADGEWHIAGIRIRCGANCRSSKCSRKWPIMNRYGISSSFTALAAIFVALSACATEWYVSPMGNDANPGTPERPLATIEKARDLVRSRRDARPATVHLRAGVYPLREGLCFTVEDSGTASAPIVYRAFAGEEVRLVGGRTIDASDFTPVSDLKIATRLDPAARGKVLELDLARLGIRHAGRPADTFVGTGGLLELVFQQPPHADLPMA